MSKIEWTDTTWNPVTGCLKISPGCKNCYAEGIAERFWAKQYAPNADGSLRKFTNVRCHPERIQEPLHWKSPRMVFVNSMSDLFHEDVPFEFIDQVFAVMTFSPEHTFQILTKRPERMAQMIPALWDKCTGGKPLPNVWLGVSVENQKYADERIPLLLDTTASVRFISAEPLLGPIAIRGYLGLIAAIYGTRRLDWVICGGESGPGAREFNLSWAESLLDQSRKAHVPFFMKQVGSNPVDGHFGASLRSAFSGKGGDINEWPEWLRVRQFPERKLVAA